MANPRKRVPENVPGDFFVDSTCIDCDACRPECPVEAIYLDENVPPDQHPFIELNAEMAPKCPPIFEKREPLAGR